MVDEAFEYCDTNKDGLLSQKQFTAWVKQNPGALQLLETVFAKHIWSGWGVEDQSGFLNPSMSPGKDIGSTTSIITVDSDHSEADEKSPNLQPKNSINGLHQASRSQLMTIGGPHSLSPGTLQ